MTDWKQLARDHEASADHYAAEYHKAVARNTELLEALDALAAAIRDSDVLLTYTIAQVSHGLFSTAYTKAREAIRKAKGE